MSPSPHIPMVKLKCQSPAKYQRNYYEITTETPAHLACATNHRVDKQTPANTQGAIVTIPHSMSAFPGVPLDVSPLTAPFKPPNSPGSTVVLDTWHAHVPAVAPGYQTSRSFSSYAALSLHYPGLTTTGSALLVFCARHVPPGVPGVPPSGFSRRPPFVEPCTWRAGCGYRVAGLGASRLLRSHTRWVRGLPALGIQLG